MCATYFNVVVCFFIYFKRKHLHIYHNKGAIVHLINELKIKRSINLFIFFKFQRTIKRSQYFNYNRIIEGLFVKNINIIACWDIIHYDNHAHIKRISAWVPINFDVSILLVLITMIILSCQSFYCRLERNEPLSSSVLIKSK